MVCSGSSRGLRRVLSGHTCQERLRYSREEDPLIFYSSPDVSRVLWKTRFLWIHHLPILPGHHTSPNTSKAVARGGWGNITSTFRALSRFRSMSLPPWCQKMLRHPAELQRTVTWGGQRSKYVKYHYWNSHMHTHRDIKRDMQRVKWSVFEMFCHSYTAMCMICTSVFTLGASGLILYVIHYTCWEMIYNQAKC